MNGKWMVLGWVCCLGWVEYARGQELRFVYHEQESADELTIDDLLGLKKITKLKASLRGSGKKEPENRFARIKAGPLVELQHAEQLFFWQAPNICHHPLYFEDIGLERYGQDAGLLQPVLSGVHFFGRVQTLPLQAMFQRPRSCDYPLGHYRPGNENPYLNYSFPW